MSATTLTSGEDRARLAPIVLRASVWLWFAITLIGQVMFALATAIFYSRAAGRGDLLAWNKFMTHGYLAGHAADNAAVGVHLAMAAIIPIAGMLQLIPAIRRRAPVFHRWTGRIYMAAAVLISLAGLWMVWVRGTPGALSQHLGLSLNAVLILVFAALALRTAMARDIRHHRRWALRLLIAVSGVWFMRIGMPLAYLIFGGPYGYSPRTFTGPFLVFMAFATYLLPLAVLEMYLRVQDRPGASRQWAMACGLFLADAGMAIGVAAGVAGLWLPAITPALAARAPLVETLSVTIAQHGVAAAVAQYRALRAQPSGAAMFNEDVLNDLGYELLHAGRPTDAVRIFQLNVESYPGSANAYDSLGEAEADAGDTARAIADYQTCLALNPKSANARQALAELRAPGPQR